MGRKFTVANDGFVCQACGATVPPSASSCRNHCPHCLVSIHLDNLPGDRAASCGGIMQPVGVYYHTHKGWQIIHRCQRCGHRTRNIAALEDANGSDDFDQLMRLMRNGEG